MLAIPQFRKDFGEPFAGDYVIPAKWQLAFTAGSIFGLVFGGFVSGIFVKKFGRAACMGVGYRKSMNAPPSTGTTSSEERKG